MAEQKNSNVPSNSQFSPNSTLFPLSSIESYDSGSVRSQVGHATNLSCSSPHLPAAWSGAGILHM